MYSLLLDAARTWVESGAVPEFVGIWWVHAHRVVRRRVAAGARESARTAACRGGAGMTSILSRYVIRAVLGTTLLVMLVLLALSGLYLFITQQDEIGIGTYALADALLFVGLNLPKYAFDMLPIAALIGALLALGNLARSMELIVVRAAGVSVARIAMWVAGAGVILMVLTGILGELVAPQMEQYGRRMKTFEKYHDYSLAGNRSAWAKDGDTIVSVGQQSGDNRYGGVYVFNFDPQHRLRSVGRASSASIDANNVWRLENYRESRFEEDRVVPSGPSTAQVRTRLSPEFLGLAVLDPESLPGMGLLSYIRHLKENGLDARAYETAFWARIARTVAVAIIVVLAVPFAFGPMRSTGTGARTVVGIMIGVVFFLLAKMLESGGAVFDLPPIVIAWLPTALLALITAHRGQPSAMTASAGVLRRFGAMLYDLLLVLALLFDRRLRCSCRSRRRGDHARWLGRRRAHLPGGAAARDRAVLLCVLDVARPDGGHARVALARGAQRWDAAHVARRAAASGRRVRVARARSASAISGSGSIATGSRGTTAGAARGWWCCRRRKSRLKPRPALSPYLDFRPAGRRA